MVTNIQGKSSEAWLTHDPAIFWYEFAYRQQANLDLLSKALLLSQLDLPPLGLELLVISVLAQAFQKVSLGDPLVRAQSLSDETGQLRVAVGQPPTGGHSIGLVLEFLWCQLIEVLQQLGPLMILKCLLQISKSLACRTVGEPCILGQVACVAAHRDTDVVLRLRDTQYSVLQIARDWNCCNLPLNPVARKPSGLTLKMVSLMISEWMAATPLTALLPTTAR